jgi:hypothetical protein
MVGSGTYGSLARQGTLDLTWTMARKHYDTHAPEVNTQRNNIVTPSQESFETDSNVEGE